MANVPFAHRFGKLFGWYESSPVNRTQKEQRDSLRKTNKLVTGASRYSQLRDNTSLSPSPHHRMNQLEDMAESETVFPIMELYVEEATQPDINEKKVLWFECNDAALEKELNALLDDLNTDDELPKVVASVAKGGNKFQRVLYNEGGVCGFVEVEGRVERVYHPTTKQLIGYLWENEQPEEPFYPDSPTLFAPWDFIHFRRMHRSNSEYGSGMLEHLYRTWKRLDLGTDQMVLYRLHTVPNRHAIYVDTGDQDVTSQAETVHMFQEMMRSQISVDSNERRLASRYDAPALESMLFIPQRKEENTKIDTLQGDRDVPDVHDLEMLTKLLYGGARVPKAYVGLGDDGAGLAQASLVTQDIRFARMIRTLRKPIVAGYLQLAEFHMIFSGRDPADYDITVSMSRISSAEEEINSEILDKQINTVSSLCGLLQSLNVPNREIIEFALVDYLKLPREFVKVAALAAELNAAAGGEEGGMDGGMGPMGGGGGGMGGGLGAFGDDDFDIPEPVEGSGSDSTMDDMAGGGGDKKEESGDRRRNLMESRRTEAVFKKRRNSLLEAVRAASKGINDDQRKLLSESLNRALRDLRSIHRTGRVSLVESCRKHDGLAASERKVISEGLARRKEKRVSDEPATGIVEAMREISKARELHESEHEVVKMIRNRRNREGKK